MKANTRVLVPVLACLAAPVASCVRDKDGARKESGLEGGLLVFRDDFERTDIGKDWTTSSDRWRIREGRLAVQGARNHGIWLNEPLPRHVRVEFDARPLSDEGDVKFEIFNSEQRHQTGYIVILGGWRNTVSIIARLDEHGRDRLESTAKARKGEWHHFTAVRTGDVLSWYVDGKVVLRYHDKDPLRGAYFGFNDWNAPVEFDNLEVYRL